MINPNVKNFINQNGPNSDIAARVIREFGEVSGNRGNWERQWQEIAERVWPNYSWTFNPYWYTSPGQKKTFQLYDSTASLALNRFGAILDSLLTPRDSKWHKLMASNNDLNKNRDVRLWFESASNALFHYRYLSTANFTSQNQQDYKSLGAFGTAGMFIDPFDGGLGLRYRSMSLGEIYFCENHQGIIDKIFRFFNLTARQALQKFPDTLPAKIREIGQISPEQIFHFIHCVEPREDYDPARRDAKGKKFASYYVAREDVTLLAEGGYSTFPYATSRYEQAPNEIYGRSPGMDLLPAIKTLNEEKKTMLKQGHRVLDPVLLTHDDGIVDGFSMRPGAMNSGAVTADGRPLVHALPTGNVQAGKELMEDERKLINDGFLVSLFQILTESPQMTATEVMERTKEKGILLAPTIGRQQSERLGPMIERELDILMRQGVLPPMPPVLKEAKGEYKIIYDSPLSRAQRAEEASGVMRTIEGLMGYVNATQDPSPLDYFNWDTITPELADIQGVPLHWINDKKIVMAKRKGRQQQAQQAAAVQAAPGAAAMVKASAVASKNGPPQGVGTNAGGGVAPASAGAIVPPGGGGNS